MQGWSATIERPRVVALEPAGDGMARALADEPVDVSWVRPGGGVAPRLTGGEAVVFDACDLDRGCELAERIHTTRPEAVLVAITDDADHDAMIRLAAAGVVEHLDRTSLGRGDLARIVRWAIERNRTVADAAIMGLADPVSGLRNWRGFMAEARREAAIAARYGLDAAVAAFGLVNRERITDQHGADAGEAAVRDFGAAVGMAVRSTDLPARIGRDEFAVLLLEAGEEGMGIVVRRVRRELEGVEERERRPWALEWSHGASRREGAEGLEAMVDRARTAMERARAARLD